jgi:FkbM family methyltransferase
MKLSGLIKKLEPLGQKLTGRLPLCPWAAILERLDPRTLSAYPPPLNIRVIAEDGNFKQLRFNDAHDAWFPKETVFSAELWSEYLCVFWPHRANGHYYLKRGTVVKPGDVCLDCGACEGFFGLQALAAGAAKVICIEPSETMAICLQKTFASEIKTGRVVVENVAAGVMEGTARFSFDGLDPFSGRMGSATTAINISVTTIAKLCADLQLPRLDFIKMDIEGAEIQALEGALPLLKKFHPRLAITTYHRPFDYKMLHALAIAAGYRQIHPAGLTQRDDGIYRPVMLHALK